MRGMQKWPNFYMNEWMNVYCFMYMTQLILRSKKNNSWRSNKHSKTNKHRTRWSEHKTASLVHSQQRNTGALLSAMSSNGGSARPSDGNSSCIATRVAESEVKYPTFQNFRLGLRPFRNFRLLNIKGMKFGC